MINDEDYEVLKENFVESERLFTKLNHVASQFAELELDESGMFIEEEEILERHWLKLSSKVVDSLSESLEGYDIELLENESLEERNLTMNLTKDDEASRVRVDYSQNGELNISQLS